MGQKYRQRIESEITQEANEHLEALAWVRETNRIGVGRWFGGPFDVKDYYDAKERGEDVHAFLQRMMSENYAPSCSLCGRPDCDGECVDGYYDPCYYCGQIGCPSDCDHSWNDFDEHRLIEEHYDY